MSVVASGDSVQVDERIEKLSKNMNSVVFGKPKVVETVIIALLAGEHVLLEDVPGVGKTLIGKALCKSIAGDFCRLQFTPDLLPSDIVGSSIYNSANSEFTFDRGPIFNNIVLGDEINRAPPRTQSALLEAMSDGQVSVDGKTHELPDPFMVIATQNPFEFEGTYVLPESQLDRFLVRISVGYPAIENERMVLDQHRGGQPVDSLEPAITLEDIKHLKSLAQEVKVDDSIRDYILEVANKTRNSEELVTGVSTRGALLWYRASQAAALVRGRDFVVTDDVKDFAIAVLAHRVMGKGYIQGSARTTIESTVQRIVDDVPVPS